MIDHYCERAGPGLLAEPFNVLSNLAFVVVAVLLWRSLARGREADVAVRILIALIVAFAIASFAWHSLALPWARRLDIAALLAFQVAWLWVYLRQILGLAPRHAGLGLLAFALCLLPATSQASGANGLLLYLPTLAVLLALGLHRRRASMRAPNRLLVAAALFAIALALRTVDTPLCASIPVGTHFAWHLLTALVIWLVMDLLAPDRSGADRVRPD